MKDKVIRVAAVPQSLKGLLKGQLKFLSRYYEVIGVSSPGIQLKETEVREKIKTEPIEIKRHISPISDITSLYELYNFFRKEQPKMVHSITPKAGLLSMVAGKLAGVPVRLHTFTGLIFPTSTGFKRWLLIQMDRLLCWAATNVYPEGEGVKNDLMSYRITKKPLKIIANGNVNGIDTASFDPEQVPETTKQSIRENLGIKHNEPVFLFVGRVVSDKGVNELVRAFDDLSETQNKCHLVIVGGYENHLDPLRPETEEKLKNNTRIHTVGYKTNIKDYFAMADVLTFPSYREGFPNVVMQAAAMQLNAIVSDINGCNEIITDGDNGWIVPPKNTNLLKDKMLWCIEHPEESKTMGLKSRQLMQENYERRFVWEELLKEYKRVLNDTEVNEEIA